jgi:superfamily II DNA or RNA helicase/DNA-binding XRE family transcriptional regulator
LDVITESYQMPSDFSKRIKQLRHKYSLSQQQLADLINISVPLLKQWENGQSHPSTRYWQRIVLAEVEGIQALREDGANSHLVREPNATYTLEPEATLPIDFSANPEVVRTVVEGERLTYGHLFNPAFATEISLIDPLPHQRIAVYDHMLKQTRLRFLLADDAGAGKTIMTGLYIREMLTRRLISRILIVPPAGLVGNWEHEMRSLFNLPFRIVTGSDARVSNPFIGPRSDLLIVSVDTLTGDRMFSRLQEAEVAPYDLVVFDEAHKLAADREADLRIRRTERYLLAEALVGIPGEDERWSLAWNSHHLLLLTATPHMGKDFPYYCLWKLLEPDALATIDAFNAYPQDARRRHFIRRTKEELVYFDGEPIYPPRISNTLSYLLNSGEVSEQQLYEATTRYISTFYNRARLLNRSAARLVMSVFQRRLASSTYALLRSFERRAQKLTKLVEDMRSGRLNPAQLEASQQTLNEVADVFDEKTADEEETSAGQEENERSEERLLDGVLATSLAELQAELQQVETLLDLARQVYAAGEESKFEKLRDILRDPEYQHEKLIIFTEHRDTLDFLVHRLEGMGFTGQIAQIHGGMDYREREEQVTAFRRPVAEGGALYLVATDAAGEGINLQVCWLMVNYDIPWNPARLEQRMGRIHRYGQKHDKVYILNLVAGNTREGRVMKTVLEKLERIRRELGSDKVFDVIGELFEGVSLREYMAQVMTVADESRAHQRIEGTLTKEQVQALQARDRSLFGDGGAVRSELPRLRASMEQETYRRLLPGYVRHFLEKAAPLVDIGIEGDLDALFTLQPLTSGAMDWLLPALEIYPPAIRAASTVYAPRNQERAIFLHPGEPVFDRFRTVICERFKQQALQGAVFIDPTAERPYFYHLAQVVVWRQSDPTLQALNRSEVLEYRLIGLRHEEGGEVSACPVEHLLLLRGSDRLPASAIASVIAADASCELAKAFALAHIAEAMAERHRQALRESLPDRENFIEHGFTYQAAELAQARSRLTDKANAGDSRAKGELTKIKARQKSLQARKTGALAVLHREPELVVPGEVTFLAHALVVPSSDPEDQKRYDAGVEAIAMQWARAFEEAIGATVHNVSTAEQALDAGLEAWPGFDLRSRRPSGEELAIEVKGRAGTGNVELTENEYIKACNLRDRYWLYVVFECAKASPRLLRVQDPFGKLIVRAKGSVIIGEGQIFAAAESE